MDSAKAFTCDPANFSPIPEMKKAYDDLGYVLIRGFLDKEELENIRKTLEDSDQFKKRIYALSDGHGRESRMTIWKHPGEDPTGMLARSHKMAETAELLLGGEVYHYHSKLMAKDAKVGGRFMWHQDYGYWYQNGCLFPDMLSVFLPIDPCGKENGCLQVLEGSHKCGRIDHELVAGMQQCNEERLLQLKSKLPLKYMEMNPGDALFFHSNLLHSSGVNNSAMKRWVIVAAYNKASNDPVYVHHCPQYTPLHKVPDSSIRDCRNYNDMTGKEFMDPATDNTVHLTDNK